MHLYVQCTIFPCLSGHPTQTEIQDASSTSAQLMQKGTLVCHSNGQMNTTTVARNQDFIQVEHREGGGEGAEGAPDEGEEGDLIDQREVLSI